MQSESSATVRQVPPLARLSILWLASNLFWSAVMSQVLAERVEFFTGADKGLYLALIGGAGAVMSTLVQLIIGPLSDNSTHHKGRRFIFVVAGVLLNTIPIFLFAFSQSFWQLLGAFVLIQLFLNTATGPFQAVIPDVVPETHHGKASGWMGLWQLLGQIIGLILPGVLLSPFLVNLITRQKLPDAQATSLGVFLICAICATVLLICLVINAAVLVQEPIVREKAVSFRTAFADAFDLQLRDYPDFTRLLISRFIINVGIYGAIEFLRYYVQEALNPDDVSIATMYVALAATVGGIAGTLIAGRMADSVSKRKVIYWSCGFSAVAAIGFCLTSNLNAAIVMGLVFGIGYGAFCAVDWAFAANLMPKGKEGKYMAIFHIAFTVPQVLALTIGGLLGHAFGYRTVFWLTPVYLIIGVLLISKVRERHEIEAGIKL
jgi:MFS family permease